MTLCMREGRALNAPNDPHSSDEDQVKIYSFVDKGQSDFTYVCEYMFKYLDISLHFSDFKCEVLIEMNVALTQLHPNNWTFMKAFLILCYYLNITLNCQQVKVSEDGKVGWVSMMGARGSLFTLFNSSWKKFKTHFLKITLNPVYPDHINLFYKYYGETRRFPFYWQEFSQRFKSRTSPLLSPEDRGRYANMEIKFKASLEDRRKIVKALNEKNSLMIGKIEIIKGIQKKIANHEKMVSMKAVENQKLVKAIESLNKNFNATVKDLEETKNTVKALND
ncbi:hypothetical protein GmHk_15G045251 [Glycine max]|nr:hypothetical protein GmHk_15G045251 [Glycine max]